MSNQPEQLRALEAFWKLKRGKRAMPARGDFSIEELRPWLGNLGILVVEHAPDLRFRIALSGTQLDSYRGHSVTGRYLDEICTTRTDTRPQYQTCVTRGEPVHLQHDNSRNSAIYPRMGKLLLPLSEDGVTVDRILMAMYPLPANEQIAA